MAKLSYMKIGKKEFFLEVGDEFFTNGFCFTYMPKGNKNQRNCHKSTDRWHFSKTIEISKVYKEAILTGKCTNLELIEDGKLGNKTWKVTSIDEVKIEKTDLGELWYIGIGIRGEGRKELFNMGTSKIKERTEKQIVLETDLRYVRKWNTSWLDSIIVERGHWGTDRLVHGDSFGVFIEVKPDDEADKFEKIEEYKTKLHDLMQGKLESEIFNAQKLLKDFSDLAEKAGF